jgi:Xaa-Pro aminopeptidase
MDISKRAFIAGSAGLGLSGTSGASMPAAAPPPMSTGPREPLLDRERASAVLAAAGLDALLLARPENVYHASRIWPGLARMGVPDSAFVLLPRDPAAPISFISIQFAYYYTTADVGLAAGVQPLLVTWPGEDGAAAPAAMFALREPADVPAREARRRAATAAAPLHASMAAALASALAPAARAGARLGYDTLEAEQLLAAAAPLANRRAAADTARHLRLIKTAPEIALMRAASAANVAAALATAAEMRRLGSLQAVRNAFNARATALGNVPVFMAVDGVIAPEHEALLPLNRGVLIDCVSQREGYHGDFGRTVFIGEPPRATAAAARQIGAAWDEVRGQLRPGLRFSDVRALGGATLKRMGSDLAVPFGPHCVGLAHTEQPQFDHAGKPLDVVLEPGMIISVDCPLMEAGAIGTLHLEDLMLITPDGATAIHETGSQTILA